MRARQAGPRRAEVGRLACAWVVQMIPFIRALAPGVPVTASATGERFPLRRPARLWLKALAVRATVSMS